MRPDRTVAATGGRSKPGRREHGVVLIFALMALFAMSIAGIAFMRSVDNAGVMAGNLAFSRASVSIADLGMEEARRRMMAMDTNPSCVNDKNCNAWKINADGLNLCTPWNSSTPSGRWYWGHWQTFADNYRDYDWSNACALDPMAASSDLSGYQVSFIVHRMCEREGDPFTGPPVTPALGNTCVSGAAEFRGGMEGGSIDYLTSGISGDAATMQPYYRITVRVTGPRNVETYAVGWML